MSTSPRHSKKWADTAIVLMASSLAINACTSHAQPPSATPPLATRAAHSLAGTAGTINAHTAPASQGSTQQPPQQCPAPLIKPAITNGVACGPLNCRSFAQAPDAIAYLMRETTPRVLAVGEIHAQKSNVLRVSPTQRFATLLPIFCGNARHIVIELMTGRNDCGDDRVEQVRRAQEPVTLPQAAANQNDFFALGNVAKANLIQPHALTPTCDEFKSILNAKDQDIARMLELTATRSAEVAEGLLELNASAKGIPYVILYGGAMHNDMTPNVGREAFSYGPRLDAITQQRTTELDIVLREQVKDTESFQRLAWYPEFRAPGLEQQFVLYQLGPKSFTLIYPAESQGQEAATSR